MSSPNGLRPGLCEHRCGRPVILSSGNVATGGVSHGSCYRAAVNRAKAKSTSKKGKRK